MNTLYFYVMLAVSFAMIFLAIHIFGDRTLSQMSRRWFAAAAFIIAGNAVIECIGANIPLIAQYPKIFSLLFLLEIVSAPFTCSAQCFACDMPKLGKPAHIACMIYAALAVMLFATGKLFTVTAGIGYVTGPFIMVNVIFGLMHTTYTLVMLAVLSQKYKNHGSSTLALIGVLFIFSCIGSYLAGYDCINIVFGAFAFHMLYVYYTSLCSELMNEQILEDEKRLEDFSLQTMKSLADAIDAKDRYTNGHSHRVSEYSVILARALGWDEKRLKYLRYAGLMHDIGKIGIPDSVLNKAGRLTDMELNMMKAHTVLGSEIARGVTSVPEAYDAARSHHERYDGKGYPDGIAGKKIPEIARIISVADTFDAMNSDRIYRKALPKEVILQELKKGCGTQFDPDFAKVFADIYRSGDLDRISAEGRQDMAPQENLDAFSAFVKDLFEFFTVKYEFVGQWDERFTQWGRMNRYILKRTTEDNIHIEYDMAVISIRPAKDRLVEDTIQQKAIDTMIKSVNAYTRAEDVCAQISKTQIAVIFRRDSGLEINPSMQQIFLYFYKIFESGAFSIDYRVIEPNEADEIMEPQPPAEQKK